ncbi:uncharacterized protein LOC132277268 isoform X2 [Cornus florida]|nr:uncharacterized protein LOC132277268 isoform X2 [Cornus florida]
MKEPSFSRRSRPNKSQKLNLVCSFNGSFQPRPPYGKLRYTGGESRIISVDRNIGFSRLKSKVSELFCPKNTFSFSLKYQLPDPETIDEDAPLVLITSDDDVRCMIDDYAKFESYGKYTRLWIFVCSDNGYPVNHDISVNYLETENLNNGSGVLYKYKGFDDDTKGTCVNSLIDSLCDNVLESQNLITHLYGGGFGSDEVKNLATNITGVRNCDNSLRKMVVKQPLLGNPLAQVQSFHGGLGLPVEQANMELMSENKKSDQPLMDLNFEPESHMSQERTNPNLGGDRFSVDMLDYINTNIHFPKSENFGNLNQLPVFHSHPLNPRHGNLPVEGNHSMQCLAGLVLGNGAGASSVSSSKFIAGVQFPKQSCNFNMNLMPINCDAKYELRRMEPGPVPMSNLNRENIRPQAANCDSVQNNFVSLSCSNQLNPNVYPIESSYGGDKVRGNLCGGTKNNRFCNGNAKNQRNFPYYIRNHRSNLTEMGKHRSVRIDGRPWVGKFYPGLRPSSSISKQGQAMRSYRATFCKPWSSYHDHTLEGIKGIMNSGLNNRTDTLDHPHGSKENLKDKGHLGVPQHGTRNHKEYPSGYHGACSSLDDQSLLPFSFTENLTTCARVMEGQEDLLTGSNAEKDEVQYQAACKNFRERPMNTLPISYDIKHETYLEGLQEAVSISGFSNDLGSSFGTGLGCNGKLSNREAGIKSFGNHQNSSHAIQRGIAHIVHLSLCNLSLSSSKEVESSVHSSAANNDVSEPLLKPQPELLDLMDEEYLSSTQLEKSNGVASNYFSQNAVKLEKEREQKQEIQQDPPSSSIIVGKADIEGSHKCTKVNGEIPTNLAAFYTHLATPKLQTINNSDLEYIKELGSGTYGTVFHGKWKGSDVAIKKIKPSCFDEGALQEDRLVEDFWKEAHILGRLHHPNIVAFYGVVTDSPVTNLAAVTEFMFNGSLKQVLLRKDRTIDRRKRLIIAMDAAFGMEYLHEKKIVHFDLKSHNFLVNMRDPQRPICKIGDLGLSKIKKRTLVSGGVRGTIPWMAPELLNS